MNDSRRFGLIPSLVLVASMLGAADAVRAMTVERVGVAYDAETNEKLYTETHRELYQNGQVITSRVIYRDAEGRAFAEKSLDFRSARLMPDFRLENDRNGHIEGARRAAAGREVVFRRSAEGELERELLAAPENGIIDAGFDRFIEDRWEALIAGDSFGIPFLVPSYKKFLDFRIRILEAPADGLVTFRMEPKSAVLRLFAEPIDVTYDVNDRALKRYLGVSNIKNRRGENLNVRVDFPAASRRVIKN